jgi:hypothetical protein
MPVKIHPVLDRPNQTAKIYAGFIISPVSMSSTSHSVHSMKGNRDRGKKMVHIYSKGWFIQQLKNQGITKHPIERRKLELYKTYVLRNLYTQFIENYK